MANENPSLSELKNDPDRLLTQAELCAVLKKSGAWAERARWARIGPPYLKIGRSVAYRGGDVLEWVESHRVKTENAA
ncbi:MAG: helix-turn-helix transcriptional regulator [Acidiferrobacterales bacterium]